MTSYMIAHNVIFMKTVHNLHNLMSYFNYVTTLPLVLRSQFWYEPFKYKYLKIFVDGGYLVFLILSCSYD